MSCEITSPVDYLETRTRIWTHFSFLMRVYQRDLTKRQKRKEMWPSENELEIVPAVGYVHIPSD